MTRETNWKQWAMAERAAWIYYLLRRKSLRVVDLARDLGVSPQMVRAVIRGMKRSRRIQEGLAVALGMSLEKVWGKGPRKGKVMEAGPECTRCQKGNIRQQGKGRG